MFVEVGVRKDANGYTPDEFVLDEITQPLSSSHEQEIRRAREEMSRPLHLYSAFVDAHVLPSSRLP